MLTHTRLSVSSLPLIPQLLLLLCTSTEGLDCQIKWELTTDDTADDDSLCYIQEATLYGYGHQEVIDDLLTHSDRLVSAKDKVGNSLLHYAAATGREWVAESLLEHSADVGARNEYGTTPLHYSALHGQVDVAAVLLDHSAEVNANDYSTDTPLHWVAGGVQYGWPNSKHKEVAELLLNHSAEVDAKNSQFATPLHNAASTGHADIAEILLQHSAVVDARDYRGQTPLHLAAAGFANLEVAQVLINSSADVNAADDVGTTPLQLAAIMGEVAVARLLINSSADVNAKDNDGDTALTYAAFNYHKEIEELLIENGADPTLKREVTKDEEDKGVYLIRSQAQDDPLYNLGRTPSYSNLAPSSGNRKPVSWAHLLFIPSTVLAQVVVLKIYFSFPS